MAADRAPDAPVTPQDGATATESKRHQPLNFWAAFAAPGKVTFTDANVKMIIAEGWGMQELVVHRVGEIGVRAFEKLDRAQQHEEMKSYFNDTIDITPDASVSPRLPDMSWPRAARSAISWYTALGFIGILIPLAMLAWALQGMTWLLGVVAGIGLGGVFTFIFLSKLVGRFKTDHIWPGLMEERLGAAIERKFPHNDNDVRAVIDHYAHIFLDSNWMLVRLKRFFQTLAIICFYLAAAAPLYFLYVGNTPAAAISGAAAVVFDFLVVYGFWAMNSHIYKDKYLQSLRVSAQHVSNLIRDRMNSISLLYKETIISITQDSVRGEVPKAQLSVSQVDDIGLREYNGFFAIQTLIWLAKRLEYIELHLHNKIHTLLTAEAMLSIAGYVMFLSLLVVGIAPALCVMIQSGLSLQAIPAGSDPVLLQPIALEIGVAIATILFTAWVSSMSFYNEAWNPMKTQSSTESVLDQHFDPKDLGGWQTFNKQELDVKLAARFQRAMFFINEYYSKLGQRIS